MSQNTTKELSIVLVRRRTESRLMIKVTTDRKKDPRKAALEIQKHHYPDWMVIEVGVSGSKQ